jgi:O-antigen/teichoic acid export membrane protein
VSADGLGARGVRALRWNYLGNGLRALSQFVVGVVLARLLGPDEFGTVAMAGLVVGMGALVADMGFGVVLVQRPEVLPEDVRFVAMVQVAMGALLSLAGVASASVVATWFHRPEAAPIFRAMSAMFLLQSFGLTPLALLRRALDFRGAQLVTVASYLGGYVVVGVPMALAGFGAWSLAVAQIVQSALSSALALWRHGGWARPHWRRPSPGLFGFGVKVIGTNLANWGLANADGVVVGRALGAVDLGLYGRAMAVVLSPLGALTSSLQGVLFAACARAQDDQVRLRRAWLGATSAVAAASLPIFVTVAVVPEAVVGGIYGDGWTGAAPVLVPLALAMPVMAVMSLAGPVVTAVGRVGLELRVALWTLALLLPTLLVAGRLSVVAVAWSVLAVQAVRAVLMVLVARPLVGASWPQLLAALAWPAAFGAATATATAFLDRQLVVAGSAVRLLADVAVAGASLAACLRLLGRRWLAGTHGDLLRGEGRLPAVARWWLRV